MRDLLCDVVKLYSLTHSLKLSCDMRAKCNGGSSLKYPMDMVFEWACNCASNVILRGDSWNFSRGGVKWSMSRGIGSLGTKSRRSWSKMLHYFTNFNVSLYKNISI